MNKELIRYIEGNTMSNCGTSSRNDEYLSMQLSTERKGKKNIESNLSIFSDVWMSM